MYVLKAACDAGIKTRPRAQKGRTAKELADVAALAPIAARAIVVHTGLE